jgi:hypothetical protein
MRSEIIKLVSTYVLSAKLILNAMLRYVLHCEDTGTCRSALASITELQHVNYAYVFIYIICTGAGGLTLKEIAQKLAETSNTVRLLEERLKEKETTINRLEQEKGKIESYAKRTITTFKVHFV